MPAIFGTTITSVDFSLDTGVLLIAGEAFGINQYPVSAVEYRRNGGAWTAVTSIESWSDTAVTATIAGVLLDGDYDVRLTSSDGEVSNTVDGAWAVSGMTSTAAVTTNMGMKANSRYSTPPMTGPVRAVSALLDDITR